MKKVISFILRHKKKIIVSCCVLIIGISVYTDFLIRNGTASETGNYLYNTDVSAEHTASGESAKILGEAKLVDSISSSETASESDAYFVSAQLNRNRSRDEAMETLQVVIDSSETMPDVKDEALKRMINIASDIETEALVEEMVKAKGFEDCLAVINGESINVVVKSPGLLTNEVAQITEIVREETGFTPDMIKIVEKN